MSEPTRYSPAGDGVVRTDPKGPLINHYYYEQLKSENSTLEAKVKRMAMDSLHDINHIACLQEDYARLKAEVERLYRHGDLMLKFAAANMSFPAYATMAKDWNAAKEGKQP